MKMNINDLPIEGPSCLLVASDEKYKEIGESIRNRKLLWLLPLAINPLAIAIAGLIAATKKEVLNYFLKGEVPLPHFSPAEISTLKYTFDGGIPVDGSIYVRHPHVSCRYILPAVLNETLAKEKLAAFLNITAALGAKTITVIDAEKYAGSSKIKIDANNKKLLGEASSFLGADFNSASNKDRVRVAYREYDCPNVQMYTEDLIPESAKSWLEQEPLLGAMVFARINHEIRKDVLKLSLKNNNQTATALAASFSDFGVKVGSEYEKDEEWGFSFEIEWWPKHVVAS